MRLRPRQRARVARTAAVVVPSAVAVLAAATVDGGRIQRAFFQPEIAADLFPRIVTVGVKNTLLITGFAFVGGLGIGLTLALMRLSPIRGYRWLARGYIELFRGIPAIVTFILVGFAVPIALGVRIPGNYGPAVVGLSIVAGAYMAETIRAGIEAVPRGQTEAARSLGMSQTRALVSIVIPQAFRVVIPPLTNELVLLLKDSSLVYVLGTTAESIELSKFGRDAVSKSFNGTPITVVALLYLAVTLPLTQLAARLERRGGRSR
ncbi:MAG: amino acid ABC transporter permease [Microthrixaceae bacterium]